MIHQVEKESVPYRMELLGLGTSHHLNLLLDRKYSEDKQSFQDRQYLQDRQTGSGFRKSLSRFWEVSLSTVAHSVVSLEFVRILDVKRVQWQTLTVWKSLEMRPDVLPPERTTVKLSDRAVCFRISCPPLSSGLPWRQLCLTRQWRCSKKIALVAILNYKRGEKKEQKTYLISHR